MTTADRQQLRKKSNDISGVMDETERNSKVERLNQISNTVNAGQQHNSSSGGVGQIFGGGSEMSSMMVEVSKSISPSSIHLLAIYLKYVCSLH